MGALKEGGAVSGRPGKLPAKNRLHCSNRLPALILKCPDITRADCAPLCAAGSPSEATVNILFLFAGV